MGSKNPTSVDVIEAVPTRDGAPTYIRIPQEYASNISVNDPVRYLVLGKINSIKDISKSDESQKKYQLELLTDSIDAKKARDSYPLFIQVNQEDVPEIHLGDSMTVMLSGRVKNIQKCLTSSKSKEVCEIELAGLEVSSYAMNAADHEVRRMTI